VVFLTDLLQLLPVWHKSFLYLHYMRRFVLPKEVSHWSEDWRQDYQSLQDDHLSDG
jgi:hypothetical protein